MADATIQAVRVWPDRWAFNTNAVVFAAGDTVCNVPGQIEGMYEFTRDIIVEGVSCYYTHAGGAVEIGMIVSSDPSISHWLENHTMPVIGAITKSWQPLSIPVHLDAAVSCIVGYLPSTTAIGDTMVISAWGRFVEAKQEDAQAVRFVAPQTVQVEGVRLWSRR